MITIPGLCLIGGNSRHSGKTSLACRVIRKLGQGKAIGLKVTRFHKDEGKYHGDHASEKPFDGKWDISEELSASSEKDTSQMLASGAKKVYYIRVEDEHMEEAFQEFLALYHHGEPIVCESRTLRDVVKPGIFILMIRHSDTLPLKDITIYRQQADLLIESHQQPAELEPYVKRISFEKDQGFFIER